MKIKTAKNGRKYKIMANGQARFIKMKSSRKRKVSRSITRPKRRVRTMAKRKQVRKSQNKGFLSGINKDLMFQGVGSGTAGLIGSLVGGYIPALGGNVAQAGVGLLLNTQKGMMKSIGKGMIVKTIGDLVEDNVLPALMGGSLLGAPATNNETW